MDGSAQSLQTGCPPSDDVGDLLLLTRVHVISAIDQRGRHTGGAALVTLRHHANIGRLLKGQEKKA